MKISTSGRGAWRKTREKFELAKEREKRGGSWWVSVRSSSVLLQCGDFVQDVLVPRALLAADVSESGRHVLGVDGFGVLCQLHQPHHGGGGSWVHLHGGDQNVHELQ